MKFSLDELVQYTNAQILKTSQSSEKYALSTDTRKIGAGDIYLPLVGERFNGHDFVEQAVNNGAVGYFTSDKNLVVKNAQVILYVQNTLEAYLQIANAYKRKINPKTIAITGSSGKTTTKEMIASVCEQFFVTHKSLLNHNNEVGLAQTLLSMPEDTEVLVVEMGMRGLGEIDFLAKYAEPDIGVVTNIGTAHLGRLGSVENIAKAKMELSKYVKELLIVENNPLAFRFNLFDGQVKNIDLENNDLKIIEQTNSSSRFIYKNNEYQLNIEGDYNIINSMFAIEVGLQLGIPTEKIAQGLSVYKPVGNRWKVENINGFKIINDSYNANPNSVKCALKTFLELSDKPHVFVFGDMGELGEQEEFYHKEIGHFLNNFESEILITVGKLAKITAQNTNWQVQSFDTNEEAGKFIKEKISKNSTILLKASRAMEFEKIILEIEKL